MASQEHDRETAGDQPPLWGYVTKLEKLSGTGGGWSFKCNFCSETRKGSYYRVRAHLIGEKGCGVSICKKPTKTEKREMKQLDDEYDKKAESQAKEVQLPCEAGGRFKKRKGISTPIEKAFGVEIRDQLDQEIARMFYTGGLPFNLARNPNYVRAFQFAATNKIDGYVPPGYNKLRTTLLQKEKDHVHKLLEPLRSTWKDKGVSIVSDGWSDPTRKPLINFIATSCTGPLFLKAVNCFGEVKDRNFIANLMKEVINEIGHQNVVQIITDNAANCKAAGEIIESQFPHIFWTPCVVHTLNLALKNICSPRNVETNQLTYDECSWIKVVHGEALEIKNFIMNHNMRLSIFSKFTPLRLLSVADTRFASIIVMLKRLKLIKRPLQSMVISDEWSSYRLDDSQQANHVKCFRRLFPNDEEHSKVLNEYAMFSIKSGPFVDLISISSMGTMEPKNWWANFGAQTPLLQTLAFKLLGQPTSSSCAERNWSTYAFIHSLKRNKLTPSRAQDLVYIHNNLRLLSRTPNDDVNMWDVGGDAFDSMEDVGFLEVANLSLDEPRFENDIISET